MTLSKRYLKFCMRVPYKRYIATRTNDNPTPSTPVGAWENSHNFYLESFNNCLHYRLASLNLYSFGMGYERSKSAIFGAKRGGGSVSFVAKLVQPHTQCLSTPLSDGTASSTITTTNCRKFKKKQKHSVHNSITRISHTKCLSFKPEYHCPLVHISQN